MEINFLSSITESWVSIKPVTAMACIALCVSILSLFSNADRFKVTLFSSLLAVFLMVLCALMYGSAYLSASVSESKEVYTIMNGLPSWGTVIAIMILGLTIVRHCYAPISNDKPALVVAIIASLAILGYLVNEPALYYYVKKISTAMSIITAVYLLILSLSLRSAIKGADA